MLQGQNHFADKITPIILAINPWRKITVEGLDHGLQGFQRNSTVPFGQNIDPQSEQHAGPFWAQRVSHTYTPQHMILNYETHQVTSKCRGKSKTYHLQSVTAPSSPAAPCRAET